MKILISGHNGFVGRHLLRKLKCLKPKYKIVFITRSDFKSETNLLKKISVNDTIFHFAGVNRDISEEEVFRKNNEINLVLYRVLEKLKFKGKLLFSSSIQEDYDTPYGKSKKDSRLNFQKQSLSLGYNFYGIISPNIFGPFCKPNYNSFIATFSSMIINDETPKIYDDKNIKLIYVGDFIDEIIKILNNDNFVEIDLEKINSFKVSDVLKKLNLFKEIYIKKGEIPDLSSHFDLCLFNTFRSYIDLESFFPRPYKMFSDSRGIFSELSRSFSEAQTSFSSTYENEIRGNHFHTRKIERFSVIKGKAKIQLREILSEKKLEFIMDSSKPSYIDIPIWFTHNIQNIGSQELITVFWINEHYCEDSPDTYIENV